MRISAKDSLDYYQLKRHKQWYNKGCSELLHQRKQTNLHWIQQSSEMNGYNLNIRHQASRHFRNKKREYLKDKIYKLAMNSKNWNIREMFHKLLGSS
jgi:hypothetical protein